MNGLLESRAPALVAVGSHAGDDAIDHRKYVADHADVPAVARDESGQLFDEYVVAGPDLLGHEDGTPRPGVSWVEIDYPLGTSAITRRSAGIRRVAPTTTDRVTWRTASRWWAAAAGALVGTRSGPTLTAHGGGRRMTDAARARTAVALFVVAGLVVVVFGGQFGIAAARARAHRRGSRWTGAGRVADPTPEPLSVMSSQVVQPADGWESAQG